MQVDLLQPDLAALAVQGKLAQLAETRKDSSFPLEGWAGEPKYDGWRIIAVVGHDHVDFYARSGKTYNGKLPKIEAELLAHFPAGTVLDGEAVALKIEGGMVHNLWGTTQSVMTTLGGHAAADTMSFMVFDLLAHRGIDARDLPYSRRRKLLERIFEPETFEAVALTTQVAPTEKQYEVLIAQGFEGMILKRLDAPYSSGKRGAGWERIKAMFTIDAVVMGFQPGKEGFSGLVGAVVFGQHDEHGTLVERGRCSGMDMRTRLDITNHPDEWLDRVIEVGHMGVDIGKSDSGRFRHPQFKRVREDRSPESVVVHDG